MTARRRLSGLFALLAMMHLVVVGTASACAAVRADTGAMAPAHTSCPPGSSHSTSSNGDRPTQLACCAALASCAAAPLPARTIAVAVSTPSAALLGTVAERAPSADSPAPELPPPKA